VLGNGNNVSDMIKLFFTAFLIGGGGNIINDYYDRAVDAINKPWRPIPSGLIRPREALITSLIFFASGIVLAFLCSIVCGVIAISAVTLVYLYSYSLKRRFLIGNITIAFLTALAIIYGSTFSHISSHVILASLYAFLFNLGREFLKGIEDVEGDKMFGVITIASIYGPRTAFYSSAVVFTVLVALSIIPIFTFCYGIAYTALAFLVDSIIVISLIYARSLRPSDALKATRVLKSAAFAGILAFLLHSL
jgi:geranylgeranylglycerol-phosphate geranylgeranyltransferase